MSTIFTVVQINECVDDSSDWAEPFIVSYRSRTGAEEAAQEQIEMLTEISELPEQTRAWFSIDHNQWKFELINSTQEAVFSFIITETTVEE